MCMQRQTADERMHRGPWAPEDDVCLVGSLSPVLYSKLSFVNLAPSARACPVSCAVSCQEASTVSAMSALTRHAVALRTHLMARPIIDMSKQQESNYVPPWFCQKGDTVWETVTKGSRSPWDSNPQPWSCKSFWLGGPHATR